MGQCLPEDMNYVIANSKLQEDFDIASTHMVLVDAGLSPKSVKSMIDEMEQVDGVKYVLGLESVRRLPCPAGDAARQHQEHSGERPLGAAAHQLRVRRRQRRRERPDRSASTPS